MEVWDTVLSPEVPEAADSEPVFLEPVFSETVFSDPVFSDPLFSDPVFSEPVFSDPVFSEPDGWVPLSVERFLLLPASAEPELPGITNL